MNESSEKRHDGEVTIEEARNVAVDARSASSMSTSLAIVLGAALVAGALYWGLKSQPAPIGPPPGNNNGGSGAPPPTAPQDVTAGDLPVDGNPSAPVVIVEWADYQCPFCGRFYEQVEKPVRDQYIKAGKVQWAYRDFAFLGQESTDAAVAARCANEQGKFWAYHDKLFDSQAGENQGAFSKDNLKKFAQQVGLNAAQFNNCLDSNKYADAVAKDTEAGRAAGVQGTPTSFVNGKIISGAQPLEVVKQAIEAALAQ